MADPQFSKQNSDPSQGASLHSIEYEQFLLGAILLRNDTLHQVGDFLEPEHFFEPLHAVIYRILRDMIRRDMLATPITLRGFLPADLDIGGTTPAQYLARLAAAGATIINAPEYARLIHELASLRAIDGILHEYLGIIGQRTVEDSAESIGASLIERLTEVSSSPVSSGTAAVTLGEAADQAESHMSEIRGRGGALGGITTGLLSLDAKTDGMHAGELIILAGRPGMGKTGLAQSIALKSAMAGYAGVYFSLEMGAPQLAVRALSDVMHGGPAAAEYSAIQRGRVSDEQAVEVAEAARRLRHLPLMIEQQPALTLPQILARARKHKAQLARTGRKLHVVYVDHIHIIRPNDRYHGNRTAEITEISGGLKALAKELGVAVVALAQLSRAVEQREEKRPTMSDLRDSGSIEQDADLIMFLYREAYYLERMQCADPAAEDRRIMRLMQVRNILEVSIAKQRNGPTGTVKLFFDAGANATRDLEAA